MTHEILAFLWRGTLISSVAICLVFALRMPARRWLGAQAAYLLWALVPCAFVAAFLPAPVHPLTDVLKIMPAAISAAPAIALAAEPAAAAFDPRPWLLAVWVAGALALLAMLVWQQRRYLRSLGDLVAGDDGALRAQGRDGSPALVGALRPRIVLPHDFDTRFNERERELVLAHERTHLLRGDAQANALVALLRCLNWFNPLFHFAASRLRFDQELACDALVMTRFPEARRPYADAMLKAQLIGETRQELRLPIGCYWPSTHPLKERIAMLKSPILSRRRRALASAVVVALALSAGYASWAAQPGGASEAALGAPEGSGAAEDRIGARFVLAIDGDQVVDTININAARYEHAGWQVSMDSDELTLSGPLAHQSLVPVVTGGRPFTLDAKRGSEEWRLSGVPRTIGDGTYGFEGKVEHNGAVVSRPSLVIVGGETAAIEIGESDDVSFVDGPPRGGGFKGIRIELTLARAKGSPSANENLAEKNAAASAVTSPEAPYIEQTLDAPPSEKISFRRVQPPQYPADAIKARIQGKVVLKVQVDAKGNPVGSEVVSTEPKEANVLADSAIAAAMQWRYEPAIKDGKPAGGFVMVPVDFRMTEDDQSPVRAAAPMQILPASYRKMRPPLYPASALAEHATGTVWVRARLTAEGAVREAHAEVTYPQSASSLADAAVDAIRGWTFNPAMVNGAAVEGEVVVPLQFLIAGYTPPPNGEVAPAFPPQTPLLETIMITAPTSCGNDCPPPPPPPPVPAAPLPMPPLPPQPINAASITPALFDIFPREEHC
ncbi:MAG: TonB family protein [Rudaea sp.]